MYLLRALLSSQVRNYFDKKKYYLTITTFITPNLPIGRLNSSNSSSSILSSFLHIKILKGETTAKQIKE